MATTETGQLLGSTFQGWAEPWSRLGLWLSLWDEQANCVEQSQPGHVFWEKLARHSEPYWQQLRQQARLALRGEAVATELAPHSGVILVAVPVRYRQRIVAAVLACGLSPEFFDREVFARFCSAHEVDGVLFEQFLSGLASHSLEDLHAYADILQQYVEASSIGARADRDVQDLSAHLAQAYEELSLLYRVSTDMRVSQRPVAHVERICREVLEASVVETVATVLEPPPGVSAEPTVVIVGPARAAREDVLQLYRQMRDHCGDGRAPLIVHDVRSNASFAWAAKWLRQFVFFDLSRNGHVFGGLLAINHSDEEQLSSQEIQLVNAVAERCSAFLENVRLYDDLEQLFMGMLHALVSSIDAKDPYTCGHSQRVAWLGRYIAGLADVPETSRERVYLSGLLHDVGKIGVGEAVLGKTGRLTADEFEEMKRHPQIGAHILEGVRQVQDVIPGVLHHHERMDGRGYPGGLKGRDVPLLGRIICLADCFDAITTDRTYREAQPVGAATAEIRRCAGTQFDPELVDLLLGQDLEAVLRNMARSGRRAGAPGLCETLG